MSQAGTDLTSTLTTQGDILYRDGSGLQRLGAGTSGQVLQTGGTGANPSWNDASGGGLEFISKHNLSANTGEWIFDQVFANNTSFNVFEIYYYNLNHTDSSDNDLTMDLRKGASGSEVSVRSSTALFYHRIKQHGGSGGSAVHMQTDAAPHGGIRLAHSGTFGGADSRGTYGTITVFNPHRKDGNGNTIDSRCFVRATHQGLVSSNSSGSYMFSGETIANYDDNSLVATGFSLKSSDYNLRASSSCQSKVLIFGVKES